MNQITKTLTYFTNNSCDEMWDDFAWSELPYPRGYPITHTDGIPIDDEFSQSGVSCMQIVIIPLAIAMLPPAIAIINTLATSILPPE